MIFLKDFIHVHRFKYVIGLQATRRYSDRPAWAASPIAPHVVGAECSNEIESQRRDFFHALTIVMNCPFFDSLRETAYCKLQHRL